MTYKSMLIHMDATERCEERLKIAGELASRHGAHLTGLFVIPEPFYPFYADSGYYPQDLVESQEKESQASCETAERNFRDFAKVQGLESEWRTEQGPLGQVVSRHARYADLTIVGEGAIEDPKRFPDPFLAEDVVMESGRPVLVIPNTGHFSGFGKRVLVCWNASREAVRAVADAMPLLQAADKVTVLAVNPQSPTSGDHGEIPSADIALYLARHGINAEAATTKTDQGDVGEVILARALDNDADLIVAGAYGHSRTREWILGGVTKTLLRETPVPAFLSH